MLAKLYHTAAIVSIAIVLAAAAVSGLMYGTGRLTGERIDTIAKVLRGELDGPGANAEEQSAGEPAEDALVTAGASGDELRHQQREMQLRRALTERARRDLIAQRELLDQALQHLINAEEQFAAEQTRAREELERRRGRVLDEGFQKELNIVKKLSSNLAKEHIARKFQESPADAVRLLNALPESTSKRILGQMKSPNEIEIMHELLERLSRKEVDQFEPGSGTAAGN